MFRFPPRRARGGAHEPQNRIGFDEAVRAFSDPLLVLAGTGVGVASSVVPYVCDQLAMSRLARNTFALMLALLPATATVIGALVLRQIPTPRDLFGIALVMAGIALHRPPKNLAAAASASVPALGEEAVDGGQEHENRR